MLGAQSSGPWHPRLLIPWGQRMFLAYPSVCRSECERMEADRDPCHVVQGCSIPSKPDAGEVRVPCEPTSDHVNRARQELRVEPGIPRPAADGVCILRPLFEIFPAKFCAPWECQNSQPIPGQCPPWVSAHTVNQPSSGHRYPEAGGRVFQPHKGTATLPRAGCPIVTCVLWPFPGPTTHTGSVQAVSWAMLVVYHCLRNTVWNCAPALVLIPGCFWHFSPISGFHLLLQQGSLFRQLLLQSAVLEFLPTHPFSGGSRLSCWIGFLPTLQWSGQTPLLQLDNYIIYKVISLIIEVPTWHHIVIT